MIEEKYERFINALICNFDGFYKSNTGAWFLDGETLVEFICNRKLKQPIKIGMINCDNNTFKARMGRWELKGDDGDYVVTIMGYKAYVKLYKNLDTILAPKDEVDKHMKMRNTAMNLYGIWRYNLDQSHWYHFPVPYKVGTFLDDNYPLWFTKVKYDDNTVVSNDMFFTAERIKNATQLMGLLRECAETAGFGNYIFPSFGTLLGIVREGGFINSDRDLDHGIIGWKVTREQEEIFLREVARERTIIENDKPVKYLKGLYSGRCRRPQRRSDNNRFLWTSVGHKKIHSQKGVKSCIWKFFKYNDFAWHSKGRRWVADRKFNMDRFGYTKEIQAIAKGMHAEYLEEMVEMMFRGVKINVPKLTGHCLDLWYPGWVRPRGDKSSKQYVVIIPNWMEEKKWKMV